MGTAALELEVGVGEEGRCTLKKGRKIYFFFREVEGFTPGKDGL